MNKIGKSRCEEGNDVSQAQRNGPLLLVFFKKNVGFQVDETLCLYACYNP